MSKKQSTIKLSRLWRLVIGLVMFLSLVTAGTSYGTRAVEKGYGCLMFNDQFNTSYISQSSRILDVRTGITLTDKRLRLPITLNPEVNSIDPPYVSKDGRYVAYTHYTEKGWTLFSKAANDPNAVPRAIDSGMTMQLLWLPDSRHLAYLRQMQDQYYVQSFVLGIVEADGSHAYNRSISEPPGTYPRLDPSALNSAYVLVYTDKRGAVNRDFYSVPTLEHVANISNATTDDLVAPRNHQVLASQLGDNLVFDTSDGSGMTRYKLLKGGPTYFGLAANTNALFVEYTLSRSAYRVDVFRADGHTFLNAIQYIDPFPNPLDQLFWSGDGQTLTSLETKAGITNVIHFHLADGQHETVVSDISPVLWYAPGRQHLAVQHQEPHDFGTEVMDADGTHRFTLVSGADTQEDPRWSPDGQVITTLWTTGPPDQLVIHLTWANADGSNWHDLADNFAAMSNVRWLEDGHSLSYIAGHRSGGFSVETLDLLTNNRRILRDHLGQVIMRSPDEDPGLIAFWWQGMDGNGGLSAYRPDGSLVYQFRITGPIVSLQNARIILSPDRHLGALKFDEWRQDESLHLASADGTWSRRIRSGLTGLGDPLWAPDGSAVAFTQSVNRQPVSLEVVTAAGDAVRSFTGYRQPIYESYSALTWTRCD